MTLTELRDKMRSYANVDENRLPDDECNDFLNDAVAEIMDLHRLRFGEAYITSAFTADTQTFNPTPSSGIIIYPTKVWFVSDEGKLSEVFQCSWEEYLNKWGTAADDTENGSGDPSQFAIYGEDDSGNPTFYLGPIPDEARTAYVTARIRFAEMSLDADENQLTRMAPRAVIYRALVSACPFLELSERAPEWQAEYDTQIKRLMLSHGGARYSAKHLRQMQEQG